MARIFGIDFFSVLSRGSQFRVEACMFRIAKPQRFMLVSPTRDQVARQAAMEVQPLILEPQSRMYTSPVVVLDFQSLYPSMVSGTGGVYGVASCPHLPASDDCLQHLLFDVSGTLGAQHCWCHAEAGSEGIRSTGWVHCTTPTRRVRVSEWCDVHA